MFRLLATVYHVPANTDPDLVSVNGRWIDASTAETLSDAFGRTYPNRAEAEIAAAELRATAGRYGQGGVSYAVVEA